MAVSKKYIDKFLNADDEFNLVQDGEAVNIENLRFGTTDDGKTSLWESILSNQEVVNPYLPITGTNISLNPLGTEDGRYLILFNYNSLGSHGIYAYRKTDNTFYKVLLESQVTGGLGFNKDYLITAKIINGLIYWTDNLNELRRINIESGIKLNHPSFTTTQKAYTSPLAQTVITLIRKPPNYPLTCAKTTSVSLGITLNNNQIQNFAGRFAWFYTYKDGETSTISSHSELVPYNLKDDVFDVILVTANVAEFIEQDVQKVTFIVIYADGEQAFEIKTWDKDNATDLSEINFHNGGSTSLTFRFTNSEIGAAIDPSILAKPYDSIAKKAKTIERANGRLFIADYEIGENTPKTTSLAASAVNSTVAATALKTGSSRRVGIVFYDKYMRQCGVVPYSKLVTVANRSFDFLTSYPYAIQWTLSNTNALNEIPDWAYYYSVVATKDITRNYFLQAYAGDIFYSDKDDSGNYTFKKTEYSTSNAGVGLRLSVLNGQGLGYAFSEGDLVNVHVKTGGITTSATLSVKAVYGDYLICNNFNFGTLNYTSVAIFEVYTPNNKAASNFFYEQGNLYGITNPTLNTRQYSALAGFVYGDVYLLQKDALNQISYNLPSGSTLSDEHTLACNFASQLFSSTKYSTGNSPLLSTSGFNSNTDNSRWIIKTNSSSVKFNFKGTIKLGSSGTGGTYKVWLEVNNGSSSTPYYIVPEQHIESNTPYTWDFNTDITVPANARVFIIAWETDGIAGRIKTYAATSMVITTVDDSSKTTFECMSPNDNYYQKWFTNAGRLQIVTSIGKQTLKTGIKWSNTLIDDTRTNGLSSFDALNQKLLQHELIEINKLILANKVDEQGQGNVMLAVCPTETASMYLGEVQLMGASQVGAVATTDSVIGSVNVLKGSYGSIHSESIVEFRGNVFGFDALGGRFWQYSINGIDEISNGENGVFKFSRFAKRFADKLLSTDAATIEGFGSRPFVFAGVDPHHGEVYWSLPKLGTPPKSYLSDFKYPAGAQPLYLDTDAYTESSVSYDAVTYPYDILDYQAKVIVYKIRKRWMGSFNWTPEGFCSLDSTLYSVKDGKLYQHGINGSYNIFYGTQYRSKIAFACNDANIIKEGRAIALEANLPEWVHIRSEQPYEQSSDLLGDDFELKEGVHYAPILRDRLSPNVSGSVDDKQFKGDLIRGKALLFFVQWPKGAQANFRTVTIIYNSSTGQI